MEPFVAAQPRKNGGSGARLEQKRLSMTLCEETFCCLHVVINRLESKRGHSVLFGFRVWKYRIDNSFFPTSGEMHTVSKSDAVIRLNFRMIRV